MVSFKPGRFTHAERVSGIYWIGGWIDPRTDLDAVARRRQSQLLTGIEPQNEGNGLKN
jgi:hypothetical protein